VAIIMALVSLWSTARLHRQAGRPELHLVLLVLTVITYLYQAVVGVMLLINPNDSSQVFTIAYLVIASFAVAVTRAWALMQGRTTRHVSTERPRRALRFRRD
jgi:heme A synthase